MSHVSRNTHLHSADEEDGGQDKQRHINRVPGQLKRGQACTPCKKRRIKCDAGRPHCSSCVRSFRYLARTYPDETRDAKGVQCYYADTQGGDSDHQEQSPLSTSKEYEPSRPPKRKKTGNESDEQRQTIKTLEDRIASLQRELERNASSSATPTVGQPVATSSPVTSPSLWEGPPQNPLDIFPEFSFDQSLSNDLATGAYGLGLPSFTNLPLPTVPPSGSGTNYAEHRHTKVQMEALPVDAEAEKAGIEVMDILWPGWPPSLPSPTMLDHLVDTFFTMVPSVSRVIHRQAFLTRLALPPTHVDFPQLALLHAICAAAAMYSAAVSVRSVKDSILKASERAQKSGGRGLPHEDPKDETCFSERNAMYAIQFLKYNNVNARGLFEMAQAMVILGLWGQANSRWIDGWVMIGAQHRLAICLGLHKHDHSYAQTIPTIRRSVLGPPKNDAEREERRATMYYAMCYDVTTSASSGWVGTMPYDELTTRMPASRLAFETQEQIDENYQTYHSPDIYYNHPVADSFVMVIKGQMLLGRACKFTRKCQDMEPNDTLLAKESPEFRKLDGDIAMFTMSFPRSLRDPIQYMQGHSKAIDADLITAFLVPHIAAIKLHEPFADLNDPHCASSRRLLTEARASLDIVYLLVSSSADISYVVAPVTSCTYFFTAGRALLLFYQQALGKGDRESAATLHSELGVLKMTFTSLMTRYTMGYRHLSMLETLMQHIEEEALGHSVTKDDFGSKRQTTTNVSMVAAEGAAHSTDTHPDCLMLSDLDKAATLGPHMAGLNSQAVMNQKRGFVWSHARNESISANCSAGGSMGPSPSNTASGARVTMLTSEGHPDHETKNVGLRFG